MVPTEENREMLFRLNLSYMIVVFAVAAPLNLLVLVKLIRKLRRQMGNRRNVLLKLHLNVSDLSVCLLNLLPRIIWHITHEFYGGWFTCKLVMFAVLFCFLLSSSILAVIGLDRLWTILRPFVAAEQALTRVKWLIGIAWAYSVLNALPQVIVWDTFQVHLKDDSTELHCVSVFRFFNISETEQQDMVDNDTAPTLMRYISQENLMRLNEIYGWQHLFSAFCLPFGLTFICYAVMMQQVCRYLVCNNNSPEQRRTSVDSGVSATATTKNTHISKEATTAANLRSNQNSPRNRPGPSTPGHPAVHELLRKATTSSLMNSVGVSTLQRMGTQTSMALKSIRYRHRGNGQQSMRTSLKMLKTAFILVSVYIICWAPYTTYNVYVHVTNNRPEWHEWFDTWTKNMLLFNSVINPLLYGFTKKDLRQLGRRMRRTGQSIGRCVCCVCCICCKLFTYEWDESSDY